MPHERFYIDTTLKESLSLEGSEYHHAVRVLRVKVGDTVEIVNGKGTLAKAQVESISKQSIQLWVVETTFSETRPDSMSLAIPLMRPSKLEWVVEKVTELGVDGIYLYGADYSEKESLSLHQLERLRLITISAMKQSGRFYLPQIEQVPHLRDLFNKELLFYFGDTDFEAPFFQPAEAMKILFFTGPERGFSEKERSLLQKKGTGVKLNPHILRAETAPIVASALFFAKG